MSTLERVGRQLPSIESVSYDQRNKLRTTNGADGALVFVEQLGSFKFKAGDTTVDDDETCFATSTGRWLLETVGPITLDSSLLTQDTPIIFHVEHEEEYRRVLNFNFLDLF